MSTAVDYSVIKEIMRESIDVVSLLEHYNVDIPNRNFVYDRIRCACPIHDGDNPSAFAFDLNTRNFVCFTNHCGDEPSDWFYVPRDGSGVTRDLFLFIKLMEEKRAREEGRRFVCSFSHALKVASEITGIPIDETATAYNKELSDKLETQKWIRTMARINQDIELEVLDNSEIEIYKAMLPACDYISSRNFNDEILEFFEIGYSPEGVDEPYRVKFNDFPGRVIFPVRDADKKLVGWSGRLATDDKEVIKKHHKWMHKLDFEKGFVLYNYDKALPHIKESKELILVEGPWDVARLWSYGICNVVAVMGSALTPEQLQLAIQCAFRIKVFLDDDGAGKHGANRICNQLKPYVDVYTVSSENGKDPDELTEEEACVAVHSAKKYFIEKGAKK